MISSLSAKFLSLLVLVYQAQALVTNLEIGNANIAPDGYNRSTSLAGGQFPGTLLTGNMNDNFEITVVDALSDPTMATATSVHWHGLYEMKDAWSDGTAMITQCPIIGGNSFLYNFTATGQAGTFWYHSHFGTQYCDGLRGPFIIYDPNDPHMSLYDVDDETTVITLADWYHTVSSQAGNFPTPDSTLINGLGRYMGGPNSDLAVVNVEQGKRYRFRIIDMGCEANFVFQIDGHTFTIIEADGVNTNPLQVDSVQILAGQRYSVVLEANQPVGNYWIRANPSLGNTGFENGINSAILRYQGATEEDPTTTQGAIENPFNEVNLSPLANPGAPGNPYPGGADININLDMNFDTINLNFTVNGESFVPPTVPVLLQILSGAQTAAELLPSGLLYTLPPNQVIEVSMPGLAAGGPHPFHLHGHVFDVVRSANSSVYNYKNPARRDTVNTGMTNDNVTIRFETDNAGPWILHCHIDWHLALGLAVVFSEDTADITPDIPVPEAWSQLCPAYSGKVSPTPQ